MYGLLVLWLFGVHPFGYFLFVIFLSLQTIIFCLLYIDPRKCLTKNHSLLDAEGNAFYSRVLVMSGCFYLPSLWVMSEYLRTLFLRGFSWSIAHGLSHIPGFLRICRYTGSYGMSFVLILVNVLIFFMLQRKRSITYYVYMLLIPLSVFGLFHLAENDIVLINENISVAQEQDILMVCSIQPHLDARDKAHLMHLDRMMDDNIALSKRCTQDRPVDLIVWPETAIPDDVIRNRTVNVRVKNLARALDTHLLIGSALEIQKNDYNSVVFFDREGKDRGFYHKIKLIPFAEYQPPFFDQVIFKAMILPKSYDFQAGERVCSFPLKTGTNKRVFRFGSIICSEEFYPGLLRRVKNENNDCVISVLNDQWFPPPAKRLHWQAAVMRAVEFGFPVLRSANDGITDWIDYQGRSDNIRNTALAQGKGIHIFAVEKKKQSTFYQKYGDVFAQMCCVFVIMFKFLDAVFIKA
ncbi:MAG: apolipoprotein N-acyltransferase [Candidatus Omnitrophica bacterium]|nr:apolipoprotein N-acyltransferase [Candidatus Omnitrophota bacterium]